MQPLLRLTVLVDRLAVRPDLETEHGLAVLVEVGDAVLLFDAGASGAAFRNAERLGLPWRRISRIVLSHGHRDHSGGLAPFLEALPLYDLGLSWILPAVIFAAAAALLAPLFRSRESGSPVPQKEH